jgi:hypothetical protein
MKKIFLIIATSLVLFACNSKNETKETSSTLDSGSISSPALKTEMATEENNSLQDSVAIKAKEDSLVKAHGHKH